MMNKIKYINIDLNCNHEEIDLKFTKLVSVSHQGTYLHWLQNCRTGRFILLSCLNMDNLQDESLHCIGIASSAMDRLDRIWWQQNLSLKAKLQMHISLVVPVLLYGSETWATTSQEWQKTEAFHTKVQHQIPNVR